MYLLADATVTIECPRARAFDFAANLENFAAWFPGVINIVAQDHLSPATIGKTYRETVSVPMRGERSVLIRVVDAAAPKHLITEGDLAPLLPRMEITAVAVGPGSCDLRWRMLSRNTNTPARWFVLPVARWVMHRRATRGLRRLKLLLEIPSPAEDQQITPLR